MPAAAAQRLDLVGPQCFHRRDDAPVHADRSDFLEGADIWRELHCVAAVKLAHGSFVSDVQTQASIQAAIFRSSSDEASRFKLLQRQHRIATLFFT